jgi:hypothetical protein
MTKPQFHSPVKKRRWRLGHLQNKFHPIRPVGLGLNSVQPQNGNLGGGRTSAQGRYCSARWKSPCARAGRRLCRAPGQTDSH